MLRRKPSRPWSLHALLLAYGALAILPVIAMTGYLLWRVVQDERTHLQERAQQVAAAVGRDIERELHRRRAVLEILASSPFLSQQDFAGFHAQARVAATGDDLGVLLHDAATKQQLVNTSADYGAKLPAMGDPDTFERVLFTRRV